MSTESVPTPITAESQIPEHIRENYENFRQERGLTWEQMAEQFDKDGPAAALLSEWARERANGGSAPAGIEQRAQLTGQQETADAPKLSQRIFGRGNAAGLQADEETSFEPGTEPTAE